MIQVLLKDPVIQECRFRPEETELLTGQVSSKSALQVSYYSGVLILSYSVLIIFNDLQMVVIKDCF